MIGLDIKIQAHNVGAEIEADIDKLEKEIAWRIPDEARALMDESTPSGRLYRRGSFKRGASRGLRLQGRRARGVGTRIHRASAPGQPPAEDTGRLYRDITVRRMSKGNYRVRFGAPHAGFLDVGTRNMRPRPFIMKAIERAVEKAFARYA